MVFKPRDRKARKDDVASRVMEKIGAERNAEREARDAFAAGREHEEAGEDQEAIAAYVASCEAWERYHKTTGFAVDVGPYTRLAIIFRRLKEPAYEVDILGRYLQRAGRSPDMTLQARMERAYELLEMAQAEEEDDEEWED